MFAPVLDGRALFTGREPGPRGRAASGAARDGRPHGSPVRLLHARVRDEPLCAQRAGARPTTASLKDALAGNLCRCTGYGPILAAGAAMGPIRTPRTTRRWRGAAAIQPTEGLALEHKGPPLLRAAQRRRTGRACWSPSRRHDPGRRHRRRPVGDQAARGPADVVSLNEAADLRRIEDLGAAIRIGAACATPTRTRRSRRCIPSSANCCAGWAAAGAEPRHRLRQHRQRLADRRHAAGPDRRRRDAGAAQGRSARELPLEDFFLAYGKQDRRPASSSRR
jgi:xanthine dehydrogenase small subunit